MEILNILLGGGILAFVQFLITRWDEKNGKKDKVIKAIDDLSEQVKKLQHIMGEREAVLARTHILRFNDELINNVAHTHEYFLQTLDDIATYEKWCDMPENADFKNGRTVQAAENIHRTYDRLFEQGKFK